MGPVEANIDALTRNGNQFSLDQLRFLLLILAKEIDELKIKLTKEETLTLPA
jgi:hypothetical protein